MQLWVEVCPTKTHMQKSKALVPQINTLFVNGVPEDIIN